MTTTTTTEPAASKEEQPHVEYGKNRRTGLKLLAIVVVWVGLWLVLRGTRPARSASRTPPGSTPGSTRSATGCS